MTLRPLIKHAGGKRAIAGIVADLLGNPSEICEPFAGGLGVSLTAGIRPVVTAEAIPAIRALYNTLAQDPASLWAGLDALPDSPDHEGCFYTFRDCFNADGAANPAHYIALNAWCYNGLPRFNASGGFSAAAGRAANGKELVRPTFDGLREAYEQHFTGCVCFADWREAVEAAKARSLPIMADAPYLGTFSYARQWGMGDLCALADALPIGALLCERIQPEPRQLSLLGEPQTAAGMLAARGFDLVHTWAPRDSVSAGVRAVRSEGIWRKVAA